MKDTNEFLLLRIKALETENSRLNEEIRKVKELSFKIRLTDPNFNKPLSEIETNYELIKTNKNE